jgi:hypothetical protein
VGERRRRSIGAVDVVRATVPARACTAKSLPGTQQRLRALPRAACGLQSQPMGAWKSTSTIWRALIVLTWPAPCPTCPTCATLRQRSAGSTGTSWPLFAGAVEVTATSPPVRLTLTVSTDSSLAQVGHEETILTAMSQTVQDGRPFRASPARLASPFDQQNPALGQSKLVNLLAARRAISFRHRSDCRSRSAFGSPEAEANQSPSGL